MSTVGQKVTRVSTRHTVAGSAGEQARRIQTRATVWRRITQAAGLLLPLGGPTALFVTTAQTHG